MTRPVWLAADDGRGGADVAAAALSPSLETTCIFACGALAAGLGRWEAIHTLRIVAAWLVADATLRFAFRQLLALKVLPMTRAPIVRPPRATTLQRLDARGGAPWATAVWPRVAPHVWNALMATGLALSLSTYVGREALLVTAGALLGAGVCALLAYDDHVILGRWLTPIGVASAWLLGTAALGPLTPLSAGLAGLAAVAAYARVVAPTGGRGAWWLLRWAWALLVLAAVQARQPVAAAVLAVAALAELATQEPAGRLPAERVGGARRRIGWVVSLAVVALASTHWG